MAGRPQTVDHVPDLRGGHGGRVVVGVQAHRVEHRRPRRAAGFEGGDERVGPSGDQLRRILPAPVDVAERPLRARGGIRTQPRADIDRQHDPATVNTRDRQRGDHTLQPIDIYSTTVYSVVQGAVAPPMFGSQGELDEGPYRTAGAQQCVGQLEQCIAASGQAMVERATERGQVDTRIDARLLADGHRVGHTDTHGHRLSSSRMFCGRNPKMIGRWPPFPSTTRRTTAPTATLRNAPG
jgi:hypothetical protein